MVKLYVAYKGQVKEVMANKVSNGYLIPHLDKYDYLISDSDLDKISPTGRVISKEKVTAYNLHSDYLIKEMNLLRDRLADLQIQTALLTDAYIKEDIIDESL